MKKGIPTHTFFRVVFFRHKGSLTICEVSRRVLRDAFLAVVTPGHYPSPPILFFDSRPPCGGRKKEIPPTGVPSPKGGRTYSSGKTPKERSSPYNNVVALLYPFPPHIRRRGVASLPSVADPTPTVARFLHDAPFPIDKASQPYFRFLGTLQSATTSSPDAQQAPIVSTKHF